VVKVEKHTLEAINQLEDQDYPYAATMLVYLVLERLLKRHLLQNRKTLKAKEFNLNVKVSHKKKKVKLGDAKNFDRELFIEHFLVHCALGELEQIYKIPEEKRCSKDRNDVFHSNLYFRNPLPSDYESRDAQNRRYLKTAKQHLVEASELCFPQWQITKIVESKEHLQFKS
jgi:hypothetical protein